MLTVNDFFCGCGGMGLGFKLAGFNVQAAWDFDKYAVQSYRENVGDYVQQADIREMNWQDVPHSDVWTLGFPCQDLSVAGKQAGIFEGKRSGLFFEIMRLLDETRENAPERLPKVLMAENVKGLKPYLPVLQAEYEQRGYTMQVQLFNSKYWEVPQSRERYFIVGTRKDLDVSFSFPIEQHDHIPKLSSVLESNVDEKYYVNDEKAKKIIEQALLRLDKLGTVHPVLTPDRVDKRQNGRRAKGEEEEMFTLTTQDLHGVIEKELQSVYTDKDGCAYACNARYYKGPSYADVHKSRNTQIIEPKEPTVLRYERTDYGKEIRKQYESGEVQEKRDNMRELKLRPDSVSNTLTTVQKDNLLLEPQTEQPHIEVVGLLDINAHDHSRRVHDPEGISPTVTAVAGGTHHIKILDHYRVRKLTPTEYGRLQGFPMDGWNQVVSNTQAYKQFGNAVTVSVVRAIASEIKSSLGKFESEEN